MKNTDTPRIVVIVGPTAVGKTALSIAVAKAVDGEVISADSRQVYRGLDIGSGKVTEDEMQGVPHHLLDVADPHEVFTAANFVEHGQRAIDDILSRNKVPVVVGGTGFYVDALVGRVSLPQVPPNDALREELENLTLDALQEKLRTLDTSALERMDTQNPRRLIRAIEIAHELGSVPELKEQEPLYEIAWIGLSLPRDELRERIHTRLVERFQGGMLEEVSKLHEDGLSYERMEELGLEYRYMARHLSGDLPYEEMVEQLETEIGRYAKRQETWFKRNKEIHWFSPNKTEKILEYVKTL